VNVANLLCLKYLLPDKVLPHLVNNLTCIFHGNIYVLGVRDKTRANSEHICFPFQGIFASLFYF
jgi:hypothetical protein